jgi:hypothetical protein
MNNFKSQRFLLVLIAGGLAMLSGCSSAVCKNGAQPLTANWVEKKLPTVEGAEVCSCGEKKIVVVHRNAEFFELADKYAEKFKAEGWKVSPIRRDGNLRSFFVLEDKAGKFEGKSSEDFMSAKETISVYFHNCLFPSLRDRMSTCSEVEISD